MIHKFLLYMLIALIALQSVDAMADAVKFHQPDSAFTEADFFAYKISNQATDSSTEHDTNASVDSDHCCYCHGISNMLFTCDTLYISALKNENKITSNKLAYLSQLISPDLRPPIV